MCLFRACCLCAPCMHLLSTFHLWCLCRAVGHPVCPSWVPRLWAVRPTPHLPGLPCECWMLLVGFHSFHNTVCCLHVACKYRVWHVCAYASWGLRAHAPCVLCVNCCVCMVGVYVFMFWLQTAPHRPPVCKWTSRSWTRMTTLPSWPSPTTPSCVTLQPLAR